LIGEDRPVPRRWRPNLFLVVGKSDLSLVVGFGPVPCRRRLTCPSSLEAEPVPCRWKIGPVPCRRIRTCPLPAKIDLSLVAGGRTCSLSLENRTCPLPMKVEPVPCRRRLTCPSSL